MARRVRATRLLLMSIKRHNQRAKSTCPTTASPVAPTNSPSRPAWQRERSRRIEAAVLYLHGLRQSGKTFTAALAATLRRHRRTKLKSNPRHHAPLSRPSLIRLYYAWRKQGAAAFALRTFSRAPAICEADAISFLNWTTQRKSTRELSALWAEFCRIRKPKRVASDAPLLVACPLHWFRSMQRRLAQLPRGTR